ncbi:hypothetical protein [Paraburkholderia sp. J7]|uniref:hypothetical protein n=1 Tax=Paraburkholderia sp. J7 TaxID=2805438 RepID=UPI002AB704E2|nr:hypothetical protein [Paraburkholderia sp. J7]
MNRQIGMGGKIVVFAVHLARAPDLREDRVNRCGSARRERRWRDERNEQEVDELVEQCTDQAVLELGDVFVRIICVVESSMLARNRFCMVVI